MDNPSDRPPPLRPAAPQSAGSLIVGWLRWFGFGRLIATGCAIVAVGAGGFWLLRTPPTPVESGLPFASTSTTAAGPPNLNSPTGTDPAATSTTNAAPVEIVVYVAGAVSTPGVYTLPVDARVQQAVLAAGGMAPDADGDSVNLAGFLVDGARIYVPRLGVPVPSVVTPSGGGAPSPIESGPTGPAGPIDLNTASAELLDELPGIGPSTAAAIVAHRESSGPYSSVDDLLDVRGIGRAKLDAIRGLITV